MTDYMKRKKRKERIADKIWDYRLKGYSVDEAATLLGIGTKTAYRYIEGKLDKLKEKFIRDADKILGQIEDQRDVRIKKLFNIVDNSENEGSMMKAMQLLQNEEELRIKRYQQLGVIAKDSPLVAIQNNTQNNVSISDTFKEMYPELVNKFQKIKKGDTNGRLNE